MADKSNFTPDEWKLILESVTMAGIAVSGCRPERAVGSSEGELWRGYSTDDGQNRSDDEATDQSCSGRF